MRTVCIVQARISSERHGAKVLLPLPNGRNVLQEVLWRCRQIKGVDDVCCAIPDSTASDHLLDFIAGVLIFRGPEHDVLARYARAAEATSADVIVRVTSDCPLIDPQVCADTLTAYKELDFPLVCNNDPRTFPHGFDCEVFGIGALRIADGEAKDPYDREHVCPFIKRELGFACIRSPIDRSDVRWTLDTSDDWNIIYGVLKAQAQAEAA